MKIDSQMMEKMALKWLCYLAWKQMGDLREARQQKA